MTTISDKLKEIQLNSTIVSIYTNPRNSDLFEIGFVHSISDDCLVMNAISGEGFNDGIIIRKIKRIKRIEINGEYELKIACLFSKFGKPALLRKYPLWKDFSDVIDYALRKRVLISVYIQKKIKCSLIRGFVSRFSEDGYIEFLLVDEFGREDGKSVFSIKNIDSVDIDGCIEQSTTVLYDELRNKSSTYAKALFARNHSI